MSKTIKPLIAGNWKMNGMLASLAEIDALAARLTPESLAKADVAICPPATLIAPMAAKAADTGIAVGAQDCHTEANGAHTGDLAVAMLAEAGATHIIVGHSERRADHGETDATVRAKAAAVTAANLVPIVCVGETEAERRAGEAIAVVERQVGGSLPDFAEGAEFVVAYEPVWAIGTGLTPTNDDIAEIHDHIRGLLVARFGDRGAAVRILYGGSMKPTNAGEILTIENVNGGLVGGASLKADDFWGIVSAA